MWVWTILATTNPLGYSLGPSTQEVSSRKSFVSTLVKPKLNVLDNSVMEMGIHHVDITHPISLTAKQPNSRTAPTTQQPNRSAAKARCFTSHESQGDGSPCKSLSPVFRNHRLTSRGPFFFFFRIRTPKGLNKMRSRGASFFWWLRTPPNWMVLFKAAKEGAGGVDFFRAVRTPILFLTWPVVPSKTTTHKRDPYPPMSQNKLWFPLGTTEKVYPPTN